MSNSPGSSIRRALEHRAMLLVCVVLGLLVASPAVDAGLVADDIGQRAFILARLAGETEQPWWDMFVLVRATPEQLERMRYLGQLPWWTGTDVRIAFWRPLTAATHYLDYLLWPNSPALMHLHQLLWHALACALGHRLFTRLASSRGAAGAAALAFSLTHLHLSATAWLAHRNAIVALVFALLCLLAHDRWRRDGWRWGAVLGPLAFLAALLAAELGVGVLGLILAYALVLDGSSRGRALVSVLPYLALLLAWRGVYDALGYGVFGSGVYVDPLLEPWPWLRMAPARSIELLTYTLGMPGRIGAGAWERSVSALVVGLALLLTARAAELRRRPLAFAALAMVLGLVPATTTAAHDRLVVLATIGSGLAIGETLDLALEPKTGMGPRLGAAVVGVVHLLLGPLVGVFAAANIDVIEISNDHYPIAADLDDSQLRRQSLVVVHTPSLLHAQLLPLARTGRGLDRPNFTWVLHAEPTAGLTLGRIDASTFELHDPQGWLRGPDSRLLRGHGQPFEAGDTVETLDFRVRVLEVDDGRPTRIAVHMRAPVDGSDFVFVSWAGVDFVACELERCVERARGATARW